MRDVNNLNCFAITNNNRLVVIFANGNNIAEVEGFWREGGRTRARARARAHARAKNLKNLFLGISLNVFNLILITFYDFLFV